MNSLYGELLPLLDSPSRDPARLREPRPDGRVWSLCPCHSDGTKYGRRSLSLHPVFGLTCFAGCNFREIVRALRERAGVHPAPVSRTRARARANDGHGSPLGKQVAHWIYRDADGRSLYRIVRFENAGGKNYRQQHIEGAGGCCDAEPRRCTSLRGSLGWAWGHGEEIPYVLYRLPELIAADPRDLVFIVEGEKAADALWWRDLVATTSSEGAGKWGREECCALEGRSIVILPDSDRPGAAHAEDVCQQLLGVAREVRFVVLPGLPHKGDVVDWLAAGGTADALLELAERAPVVRPPSDNFPKAVDVRVLDAGTLQP